MANRAVDGTKMSMVGEVVTVKDLTKNGLNVTAAHLVTVRTASARDPRKLIKRLCQITRIFRGFLFSVFADAIGLNHGRATPFAESSTFSDVYFKCTDAPTSTTTRDLQTTRSMFLTFKFFYFKLSYFIYSFSFYLFYINRDHKRVGMMDA